ncbi:hypothetical protein [Bradyrhizobium sp. SRS-191]|uniref:hypothetical protein n=1 Tax=Bradyrhizobium sp. SRS-191 TaxID=2962606 RepID=UPI00211E95D8|nr:hypothetical protein [Bradyrhizobium sp. SRS-191]
MRRVLFVLLLLGLAVSPALPQITTLGAGSVGKQTTSFNTRVTNTGDIRITNTSNTRVTQ